MVDFKNVSLFNAKTEKFFLYYPFIFLLLIPLELFFSRASLSSPEKFLHNFLINALFFNTTHVLLTFFILFRLPELQTWTKAGGPLGSKLFYLKITAIFALLLFYFNYHWPETNAPWELEVVSIIIALLPFQHTLYQVRGLSLAYNSGARRSLFKKSEDSDERRSSEKSIKSSEFFEKAAFLMFFISLAGKKIILMETSFRNNLRAETITLIDGLLTALLILSGAAFLFSFVYLGIKNIAGSGKLTHLARLIAFPFTSLSLVASSLTNIFHGVDYYLVIKKMVSSSNVDVEEKNKNLKIINQILIVSGLLYALVVFWRFSHHNDEIKPLSLLYLNGLIAAVSFLHYYLDRLIFRMRDPETRKLIAPLISADSASR